MKTKKPLPKLSWTAAEFNYQKKTKDWYWILWIISLTLAGISVLLSNILFAVFLILATFVLSILASRKPLTVNVSMTPLSFTISDKSKKMSQFSEYRIVTGEYKLLLLSKKKYAPITVIPLGTNTSFSQLERLLEISKLKENLDLHEPFIEIILERLGF